MWVRVVPRWPNGPKESSPGWPRPTCRSSDLLVGSGSRRGSPRHGGGHSAIVFGARLVMMRIGLASMNKRFGIVLICLVALGNVRSEEAAQEAVAGPVSFVGHVLPILARAGCSSGSCHAKPGGQNGFHLSVFAHDPEGDYQEIVAEGRGRRVFPAFPPASLLLQKPSLQVPHEGGQRFVPGSPFYETLVRWIQEGMPYQWPDEAELEGIEVAPAGGRYVKGSTDHLTVRAVYADGTQRDVTHLADYAASEEDLVRVDEEGQFTVGRITGESALIVRFMGKVAVARLTIPADRLFPPSEYASLPVNHFIDRIALEHFQNLGLKPSKTSTDAEFLRRASLDAIGTLPAPDEVRAFLAEDSPEKRAHLIDRLLADPAYADHWAVKWGDLIRPNPSRVGVKSVYVLDQWLRDAFRRNEPYDRMVRELVMAKGSTHRDGPTVVYRDRRKPEELTTLVSQILLGTRLDCARCHHHPNESWSQRDFFEFAAYFAEVKRKGTGISPPISGSEEFFYHAPGGKVTFPGTGEVLRPRPLGGAMEEVPEGADPRERLAGWMTGKDNPFVARAIVNRVWAEFFGRGFVNPVDDFRASNPPVMEPLLDALAKDFVDNGYDLKHLMRTIMRSHLYQLSSLPNETNLEDTRHFSRAYRRRLPAEVMADAVARVAGATVSFQGLAPGGRAIETWNNKLDSLFMDAFGRPDSSADCPCERDRRNSVVQSLHLMNSEDLQSDLADKTGRAAVMAASERPVPEMITELYLLAYGRFPTEEELAIAGGAFEGEGATRQTALEDILWALINSAEFVFNH